MVLQEFVGEAAFLQGTVVNGGHNWPMPTTRGNPPVAEHFDATRTIVEFWRGTPGCPDGPGPAAQSSGSSDRSTEGMYSAMVGWIGSASRMVG